MGPMSHVIFTASMSPAAVDVRYTFMRPWYTGDGRLIREPGTSERGLDNSSVQSQCTASPRQNSALPMPHAMAWYP